MIEIEVLATLSKEFSFIVHQKGGHRRRKEDSSVSKQEPVPRISPKGRKFKELGRQDKDIVTVFASKSLTSFLEGYNN